MHYGIRARGTDSVKDEFGRAKFLKSGQRRTCIKKSLRPASFVVRLPPPSQDSRPRPAIPAWNHEILIIRNLA